MSRPLTFLIMPVVFWLAYRFTQREAATMVLVLVSATLWGTINGIGPFAGMNLNYALPLLALYFSTMMLTALIVSSLVNERRQMNETLWSIEGRLKSREIESRYNTLLKNVCDVIFTVNLREEITSLNPAFEKILGWKPEEWLGKSFESLVHPEDMSRIKWDFFRVLGGRKDLSPTEVRIKNKAGGYVTLEGTAVPIYEGVRVTGIAGVARDITASKRVEEELHESEERFRLFVEGAKDYAIYMLDTEGNVVSWNRGAEKIKGYAEGEIIGKHFSCFYPKDDRTNNQPARDLEEAAHRGALESEGWVVRKDGTRFWAHSLLSAIYDAEGKLKGYAKISRDFSERKKDEEKIIQLNRELEHRVHQRTEELKIANAALQREIERRDRFLAALSHELRNPLAPIILSLDLMRRQGLAAPDSKARFDVIDHQFRQMSRLLRDLLDISRATTGKIDLRLQEVRFCEIISRAIEAVRPMADAQKQTLLFECVEAPIMIVADPVRLEQIVLNLLSNAIKYTLPGGSIFITLTKTDTEAVLSVRDTGIGIPKELLPSIFEMFEQGGRLPLATRGGLGVGLALVRYFTELHGGTVVAQSAGEGQGSEFIVRLPLWGKRIALRA